MVRLPFVLVFVALTFLSWGIYGPVLHEGQHDMGEALRPSSLRPFICVGVAYFLIAVVVPMVVLWTKGEKGGWTSSGALWSFGSGAAGAVGALGIILAFKFRGSPVYVMPLVFGCAPVVNTFVSMWMAKTFRDASLKFYASVALVALGAAGVMVFKPVAKNIKVDESNGIVVTLTEYGVAGGETKWEAKDVEELRKKSEKAYKLYLKQQPLTPTQLFMIPLSIGLTALCWGSYGPVLHKGQMKMSGSRLRPLLCVGLAYFAIAVVVPLFFLNIEPQAKWTATGISWSLAAGSAGAVGALGIIMAFNYGGKPILVMPLVFGCAPVVNTFTTIAWEGTFAALSPPFFVSLGLVICGATSVLIFAPRPGQKPTKPTPKAKPSQQKPVAERKPAPASDSASSDANKQESEQAAAEET